MQRLAVQQGMAACWLLLAGQVWASGGAESLGEGGAAAGGYASDRYGVGHHC
ncbi:hypothetical protein [Paludibacterium denitrificans]|uniref:Uncharacterized protein n=1 Tax=Paludibacterium denitrificans TaxID=2675226 RepID=A0A844GE34_9NEIS|nr:hypothetical protein [Paludibacterium denitrificans]MTD33478.1 hypothetical protein [Paludibacterium denitrificans]